VHLDALQAEDLVRTVWTHGGIEWTLFSLGDARAWMWSVEVSVRFRYCTRENSELTVAGAGSLSAVS